MSHQDSARQTYFSLGFCGAVFAIIFMGAMALVWLAFAMGNI